MLSRQAQETKWRQSARCQDASAAVLGISEMAKAVIPGRAKDRETGRSRQNLCFLMQSVTPVPMVDTSTFCSVLAGPELQPLTHSAGTGKVT